MPQSLPQLVITLISFGERRPFYALKTHMMAITWIWELSSSHLFSICQCLSEVIKAWLRATLAGCGATKLWINTLWSLSVRPIKMYAIRYYLWCHACLSPPHGEVWVRNNSLCITASFAVFNDSPSLLFCFLCLPSTLRKKKEIRHAYLSPKPVNHNPLLKLHSSSSLWLYGG